MSADGDKPKTFHRPRHHTGRSTAPQDGEDKLQDLMNDSTSCITPNRSISNTALSNSLRINFANTNESMSQTAKCKAFWSQVKSRPELEALQLVGRELTQVVEEEKGVVEVPPPTPPPSHPWLLQLMGLRKLEEPALAGWPPKGDRGDGVLAYAIEETPSEAMGDIAEFEKILERREMERDPNQSVLGYRKQQPPPRAAN